MAHWTCGVIKLWEETTEGCPSQTQNPKFHQQHNRIEMTNSAFQFQDFIDDLEHRVIGNIHGTDPWACQQLHRVIRWKVQAFWCLLSWSDIWITLYLAPPTSLGTPWAWISWRRRLNGIRFWNECFLTRGISCNKRRHFQISFSWPIVSPFAAIPRKLARHILCNQNAQIPFNSKH